jgi:hypothetical protein
MRIACPRPSLAPVALVLLASLLVATTAAAAEKAAAKVPMIRAVYPVADLLACGETADGLVKTIVANIGPTTWGHSDGRATIAYSRDVHSLVVDQSSALQEKVAEHLHSLRQQYAAMVQCEVRLLSVSPAFLRQLREKEPSSPLVGAVAGKAHSLSPKQVQDLVEVMQSDRDTNMMQAPRLTAINGKKGEICIQSEERFVTGVTVTLKDGKPITTPKTESFPSGIAIGLQPVIAADRRSVRMQFEGTFNEVDTSAPLVPVTVPMPMAARPDCTALTVEPVLFTQYLQQPRPSTIIVAKSFDLPDGHTMLFAAGTRDRAVPCEDTVLNHLPLLGRLYAVPSTRHETEHLFVMVTPKLLVQAEEERRAPPGPKDRQATAAGVARELVHHCQIAYKEGKYQEAMLWAHLAQSVDPTGPGCQMAAAISRHADRQEKACSVPQPMPPVAPCAFEQSADETGLTSVERNKVAALLDLYYAECEAGQLPEAHLHAAKALAIDPTCFYKRPIMPVPELPKRLVP